MPAQNTPKAPEVETQAQAQKPPPGSMTPASAPGPKIGKKGQHMPSKYEIRPGVWRTDN